MAKDKTDYNKLTLGIKKPIKKRTATVVHAPKVEHFDDIVEEIHNVKKITIPTKRITLDIPKPLHKKIKNRVYDMEITMKQYFLDLAQKDLEEQGLA